MTIMYRRVPSDSRFPLLNGPYTQTEFNQLLEDFENWVNGFTPTVGTYVSPYSFVITSNIVGGVTYYSANNAYQIIYGGSGNTNGIDGTDAAAVMQAAIDAASLTNGSIMLTCDIDVTAASPTAPITPKSNVHLIGANSAIKITAVAGAGYMMRVLAAIENFHLENLTLDAAGIANPWDCSYHATDCLLENVNLINAQGYNVIFNHIDNNRVKIKGCYMTKGTGHTGMDFVDICGLNCEVSRNILVNDTVDYSEGIAPAQTINLKIQDNSIIFDASIQTKTIGISLEAYPYITGETYSHVNPIVSGNYLFDASMAIGCGGDQDNSVFNAIAANNVFEAPNYTVDDPLLYIGKGTSEILISGNNLGDKMLEIDGGSFLPVNGVHIEGNKFGTFVMQKAADSRNISVIGNQWIHTAGTYLMYIDSTGYTLTNLSVLNNHIDNQNGANAHISGGTFVNKKVKNNSGYVTENAGIAHITAGTTLVVHHGLTGEPIAVMLTPNWTGTGDVWYTDIDTTHFTIHITNAVDCYIAWTAFHDL